MAALLLSVGSALSPAAGESTFANFALYTEQDGLSTRRIRSVVTDHEGFVWVGTMAGLNRLDGERVEMLRHDPTDPNSLPADYINALAVGEDGTLWVGTAAGLALLRPGALEFEVLKPITSGLPDAVVGAILPTERGAWVGFWHAGLFFVPSDGSAVTRIVSPGTILSDQSDLTAIAETDDGYLWLGGNESGLIRAKITPGSDVFEAELIGGPSEDVISLLVDSEGTLWVGHWLGPICRIPPGTKEPSCLDKPSKPITVRRFGELQRGGVLAAHDDGLYLIGGVGEASETPSVVPLAAPGLPDGVWDIGVESSGRTWMALSTKGLLRAEPPHPGIRRRVAPSDLEDRTVYGVFSEPGALWVSTEGGLWEFGGERPPRKHSPKPIGGGAALPGEVISSVMRDSAGLWVGVFEHGPHVVGDGAAQAVPVAPGEEGAFPDRTVFETKKAQDGSTWFATGKGLARRRAGQMVFDRFASGTRPSAADERWEDVVFGLAFTPEGQVITATEYGVSVLDPDTGESRRFLYDPGSATGNYVTSVASDSRGAIWATSWQGLYRIEPETGGVRHYGREEGLPSATLFGVLVDREDRIWFSSTDAVSVLDQATGSITTFAAEAGIPPGSFDMYAHHLSESGEVFFGGPGGVFEFDPQEVRPPVAIPALLTGVRVMDTPVEVSELTSLRHDENFVSFDFARPSFQDPRRNRYRYRLSGVDPDWREAPYGRATASYSDLRPGRYIFRLSTNRPEGGWTEPRSISLYIIPPWYRTPAAYLFGIAALVTGLVGLLWLRYRVLLDRQRAASEARFSERLSLARDMHDTLLQDFAANIFHTEAALKTLRSAPAKAGELLETTIVQSQRALADARRTILMQREPEEAWLPSRWQEAFAGAAAEFDARDIHFCQRVGKDLHCFPAPVCEEIVRIGTEALRNARAHSGASIVVVSLERSRGGLLLSVKDNGRGFEVGKTYKGRLGLVGMRERTTLIGGQLSILTQSGKGTKILLDVPRRRGGFASHLSRTQPASQSRSNR
ncbi:sensor histidine kinase [Parvularcula maris]|uniref:Histidine kinase n=1 Tax=Parvularcula maris TaxID=2965077 RepID=A0A9X2LBV3_9PROT|nr:sensor histidine kinase [Parvularcula maris]MCQ8186628.1 histidine kinase [Parvularcula maris]